MKSLTWLLFGVFLFIGCQSDEDGPQEDNSQSEEEIYFEDYAEVPQKWGYIDQLGKEIIPAKYDAVRNFKNGLAIVSERGKWGMIDTLGQWVIPPSYKGLWEFNEGLARVDVFEKGMGFININNEMVIDPQFEEVYDFANRRARIREGAYFGYLNTKGNWIIKPEFESCFDFVDGIAIVKRNDKFELIDTSGNILSKRRYDRIQQFGKGHWVGILNNQSYPFDPKSKSFIGNGWSKTTAMHQGHFWTQKGDQWILLNELRKEISKSNAKRIRYAGLGYWIAQSSDGFLLLDKDGLPVTGEWYDQLNNFEDDRAVFYKNRRWGYLDANGQEIIPAQYFLNWDFKNGLARVADETGTYFIDIHGNKIVSSTYEDVRDFFDNRARFQEL